VPITTRAPGGVSPADPGRPHPAEPKRLGAGVRGFDDAVRRTERFPTVVAGNIAKELADQARPGIG
jgi:hypothetical protein